MARNNVVYDDTDIWEAGDNYEFTFNPANRLLELKVIAKADENDFSKSKTSDDNEGFNAVKNFAVDNETEAVSEKEIANVNAYVLQPLALLETSASQTEAELKRIYEFVFDVKEICSQVLYVGGRKIFESFKDRTYPICVDNNFGRQDSKNSSCLIYSYGIDNDWGFDDPMSMLYECEVHTFDASMYDNKDHKRNKNLWFHKLALGDKHSNSTFLRGKRDYLFRKQFSEQEFDQLRHVKMRTLSTAMKDLGHREKLVDVFRIDAEGPRVSYEPTLLKNILEEGSYRCVRQLVLEMHFFGPYRDGNDFATQEILEKYSVLKSLQNAGFELATSKLHERFHISDFQDFLKTFESKNSVIVVMLWINSNPVPCA